MNLEMQTNKVKIKYSALLDVDAPSALIDTMNLILTFINSFFQNECLNKDND